MTCEELEHFLYPYLDGEFDSGERMEIELHLSKCQGCDQKVREVQGLQSAIRRRAAEHATSRAPAALRQRIQVGLYQERRQAVLRRWSYLSAAAASALVIGGALYVHRPATRRAIDDAARRHAKALPFEIQHDSPQQVEAWFGGKLDHHIALPHFPDAKLRGARISNVVDKPAAYISYDAARGATSKSIGLFVLHDPEGDLRARPLPAVELDQSLGYNVAMWRKGEVVYELVTDLSEEDIREILARQQATSAPAQPASSPPPPPRNLDVLPVLAPR
jgi:anti-sigma factor RsiW